MADEVVEVHPLTASLRCFCKDYLTEDLPRLTVALTPGDLEHERKMATMQASDAYLETLALNRRTAEALLECDTLLLHASCIDVEGDGYLFAAPSGVGKSTHTRLWREMFGDRVEVINDDKPFLKITDAGIMAYGSPWDGEHHLSTNGSVLVKAICLLRRDDTNHIESITPEEAFPIVFGQVYRPEGMWFMEKLLPLVDRLTRQTRLYTLGCNMHPEAAAIAYEKIRGGN